MALPACATPEPIIQTKVVEAQYSIGQVQCAAPAPLEHDGMQSDAMRIIIAQEQAYWSCRCAVERLARDLPIAEGPVTKPLPGLCLPQVGEAR